ncbi:MAG: toll/interleukin-1 receptor domain-containing protein [Synergistaceae bacterium]|nr:toll/interleukin-1 receptor domain-containing protein [Synergistaceae bacterium]
MQSKYQIFISYRRDGGEDLARLLENKLTDRGFKVFFDVESLRSGAFNKALFEKIAECIDVLVVLPPHALDRCVDPNDWVRLEIARALELDKNVIPIMMRNFEFPEILPADIDELRHMNGISANNEYFDASIEKLVSHFIRSKPLDGTISDEQLLEEANNGNISAMNAMGLRYEFGSESLLINQQKAFDFYNKSAQAGDPGALYNLGDVYEQCEKDLSLVYDYGIEGTINKKSADEARKEMHHRALNCYNQAVKMNFAPAIYRLANFAENDKDFASALKLYQSAADLNYPPAQNALGYYKMNGIMTNTDPKLAVALYKQAADAGYAPAIYNYAHAMELRDVEKAIKLYKKVAFGEDAIPQAALSLAHLYERSLHDLRNAVSYYRIAYETGIQEAGESLKRCQDILFNNDEA